MKKHLILTLAIILPAALWAQEGLDNEITQQVISAFKVVVPVIIAIIVLIRLGYIGIQYMLKPKDQRSESDTKVLLSELSQLGIGAIISLGATSLVVWLFPYFVG